MTRRRKAEPRYKSIKPITVQQLFRFSPSKIRQLIGEAQRQEESIKQEYQSYPYKADDENRLRTKLGSRYQTISDEIARIKNNPNVQRHGFNKIIHMFHNGMHGKYLPGIYEKLSSLESEQYSLSQQKYERDSS